MDWTGSVFARGSRLYLKVKEGGRWRQVRTPYEVGQEEQARQALKKMRRGLTAAEAVGGNTVRAWGAKWLETRPAESRWYDESRLRLHVYPVIGSLPLAEVRPRHVLEVVTRGRAEGQAARTIRNVYSVVQAMFRDAVIADLMESSPCILRRPHLPAVEDRDPEWRAGAVFSRSELERLLTPHPKIEADSRVVYALEALGMLRHGEMAGIRWRAWDPTVKPLGRLVVACSYAKRRTKTVRERWMPVHPALAAILAEWRLSGWPALMGRQPTPDDLIAPLPVTERRPVETMRRKGHTLRRLHRHLLALGLRERRGHDLRRTGISLAREDGARKDILSRGTHAPPRDVMELYTSVDWALLCEQVSQLRIRPGGGSLVQFGASSATNRKQAGKK